MSRVLVSFLGIGVSNSHRYDEVTYNIEGKTCKKTTLIAEAITKYYGIDKLILVGTPKSMWEEVYQIKFINGSYQIFENISEPQQGEVVTPKSYIAHRIDGVTKLKFNQIYTPKGDKECCLDMKVLTLDRVVFVGFEK